jgi:Holliday junction resolvase
MVRILATKGITTVGVNAAADNGERVIVDVVAAAAELDVRIELTVGDEGVVVVIVVNGDDGGGGDVVDLVGSRDAE